MSVVQRSKEKFSAGIETPDITAFGKATNIDLVLAGKGTGLVKTAGGFTATAVAVVPTADGLTTGLIASGKTLVELTATNVDHIATLPAGVAGLVGVEITLYVLGAFDCELRTPAASAATINNVDADGTDEFRLLAGSIYKLELKAIDTWVLRGVTQVGSAQAERTVALIPTADGLTTGLIAAGVKKVTATSAGANNILTLPAGNADLVGETIEIYPVGGTDCELRTPAASAATINGIDADGSDEFQLTSGAAYEVELVAVDTWILRGITSLGAVQPARPVSLVPTADGLTTGLIPAGVTVVDLTASDITHIATLPDGVAESIGVEIAIYILGAFDCELRTPAASNATINGIDADGGADEFRLLAGSMYKLELTAVDTWVLSGITGLGSAQTERPVALVPTVDGLAGGLIAAGVKKVSATSGNADHILTLPAGNADLLGETIDIYPVGGTNCELRTPAGGGALINGVDSDGTSKEALLVSGNIYRLTLVAVDTWIMAAWTNLGASLTVIPDA